MGVDAVLLDVGGVLVVADESRLYDGMVAAGMSRPDAPMIEAHYRVAAEIDLLTHPPGWAADSIAFARIWAAELGVGSTEDAVAALAEVFQGQQPLWEQVLPWALSGMTALREAGYRLGIISNADGTIEESLRRRGVCQVGAGAGVPVEVVLDSTVVGVEKPDPGIFQMALGAMGLAPERCAYVGDIVRYDVVGARAAGLLPVHLDPYELCIEPDDHLHVASLDEVAPLLSSIGAVPDPRGPVAEGRP